MDQSEPHQLIVQTALGFGRSHRKARARESTPEGIWAHFDAQPQEARLFGEPMTGKA